MKMSATDLAGNYASLTGELIVYKGANRPRRRPLLRRRKRDRRLPPRRHTPTKTVTTPTKPVTTPTKTVTTPTKTVTTPAPPPPAPPTTTTTTPTVTTPAQRRRGRVASAPARSSAARPRHEFWAVVAGIGERAEPYSCRMPEDPHSVDEFAAGLRSVGYLPGESTALVSFLATKLGKPVLVEGPAGVGKTELAKSIARLFNRPLVRLQCYEGLDEAKALYEWNYRKQLLRIQTEAGDTGWETVQDDIFGEEFLLQRPLMTAIASPDPVVLLIDEIDKTDQEFEAMLLELLSDFQISIPELGRIEARTHPVVLLTSNNTRELTEALKRRCLYLWLDYPEIEHELEIVRLHSPELSETVARKLVEVVQMIRDLDLKKPPSIAESIDWARALLLLGADNIDQATFRQTMSVIVKHRTDLDIVAERVGVKLEPASV